MARPTRIIDVGVSASETQSPRLVDGSQMTHERFAALSYCWGPERALTLRADTEALLRDGLAVAAFPKTLRDAILVTRGLNLRYLWVDALCIRQDSADDWAREAGCMRDVYKGAVVTIAAAAAAKASDGLFMERPLVGPYTTLEWRNGDTHPGTVFLRPSSELPDTTLRTSPINARAWTLQEGLLAPSTLWFGKQVLMFECSEGQVDEAGRRTKSMEQYRSKAAMQEMVRCQRERVVVKTLRALHFPAVVRVPFFTAFDLPPDKSLKNLLWTRRRDRQFFLQGLLASAEGRSLTYYDQWREIIVKYTSRHLTVQADVLPALSGLADEFARVTGDQYVAGMWRGDLIRSLSWHRSALREKLPNGHQADVRRPSGYHAPSWSWASIYGKSTSFGQVNGSEEHSRVTRPAKIVDVTTTPSTSDPYGRVSSGILVLEALMLDITDPRKSHEGVNRIPSLSLLWGQGSEHEFLQQHVEHPGQQFTLLQVCTTKERNSQDPMVTMELLLLESCLNNNWRRVTNLSLRAPLKDQNLAGRDGELYKEVRAAKWRKRTVRII